MKIGLLLESEEGLGWERWRATVRAAESLGFESIWISDHLCSPEDPERHGLDAWVALSVAAADTSRIQLGPLVSPVTFRPPTITARMAEALHALSDGRFVIGLGLGWNDEEHARFGIPFPSVAGRVALLEETVSRLRETFGRVRVPLLIGGAGPNATLPLVARYADEWNMTTTSVELFRARSDRLDELCAAFKRNPRTVHRSIAAGFLIGRNASELRERSARMQQVVPALASVHLDEVPDAARGRGWLVGTPSQLIAELKELAVVGVDRAILGHYDLDDVAALELIATEVRPGLA